MADGCEPPDSSDAIDSSKCSLEELRIVERKLLARVEISKQAYVSAKKTYRELVNCAEDVGMKHPDGRYSLTQALRFQQASWLQYSRDLKVFNEFILHGKIPEL
jgi:hypothetical protein